MVEKKKKALMVLHFLDRHPSRIKEKVDEEINETVLHSDDRLKVLLEFFEKIYKKDSLADGFDKYEF